MEENIERWHVEKLEKYSKLVCPGWQVHLFVLEIGCRGFVSSRVSSIFRKLGLNASESRVLRDNLQLVVRKCSYVIWINRFNKDFNSALRVSVDGDLEITNVAPSVPTATLSVEVKDQISQSHQSALLKLRTSQNRRAAQRRLRSTRNRKAALLLLRAKTLVYRARPSASTASTAPGILMNITTPAVAQGNASVSLPPTMCATSLPKKGVLSNPPVLIADQKHIGVTNLPVPLNPLSLTWTL